jgi:putative hydrolase of the HAD superfamily
MGDRYIKVVFFDLGDTLLDMSISPKALNFGLKGVFSTTCVIDDAFIKQWERATYKVLLEYGKTGKFYTVQKLQTFGLKNVLLKHGVDLPDNVSTKIIKKFWQYFIKNCELYEDVKSVLSYLAEKNYLLGLITNGDEENVMACLKKHKIHNLFKIKVISSALEVYKPNPLLFKKALELAQCWPHEAIYVGDSMMDICGAQQIKLMTVLLCRDKPQESSGEIKPDFQINNLSQLSTIIEKIGL